MIIPDDYPTMPVENLAKHVLKLQELRLIADEKLAKARNESEAAHSAANTAANALLHRMSLDDTICVGNKLIYKEGGIGYTPRIAVRTLTHTTGT